MRIGYAAAAGNVVALFGGLGVGKTVLAKGILAGLGGNPDDATSPTFTLIREYPARLTLYHFDAYRVASPREIVESGGEEALFGDGICVVEWAEKILDVLPSDRLEVSIEVTGESSRMMRITSTGEKSNLLLSKLAD